MARMTWRVAAIAGLLAATVGGCAHERRESAGAGGAPAASTAAEQRAQQARRSADAAAKQAATADQQLADARRRLDAARQDSLRAQQQQLQARQQAQQAIQQADQHATAAQQRIGQEQASVARLEQTARQQRDAATEAAMQAQIASEEAQGLRSAAGRIVQTSPGRMVLEEQDGRTMSFQVAPGTRVLVGTEQRSVTELQQGADARVAYDPRQPDPAAVVIHVNPAGSRMPMVPAPATPGQQPARPPPR